MSHYEERLENDLNAITKRFETVAARVETAIGRATAALLAQDGVYARYWHRQSGGFLNTQAAE